MAKPKPNYTFTEYLTLIGEADCVEDLALIEEMLQQDKEARSIHPLNYIDVKCQWIMRFTAITIQGHENSQE